MKLSSFLRSGPRPRYGLTSKGRWSRMTPAKGPLSNSTATYMRPAGWSFGTRTECPQNVPQAKPDCQADTSEPLPATSANLAPLPSLPRPLS